MEGSFIVGVRTFFRHLATAAAAGLMLTLFCGGAALAEPSTVHLHGSASLMPAAQKVAEAYMARYPDRAIVLRSGDSGPGLKSLLDGTSDIAMVSAGLSDDVLKRAKAAGLAVQVRPVAVDAIVPVVNPANPLTGLSLEQLEQIYRGTATDWDQVGGRDGEIALLGLPDSSGTAISWKQHVLGGEMQTPRVQIVTSGKMKPGVAADPLAIGYISLEAVDGSVRPLTVNGAVASAATLRDGRYPLRREMALVLTDRSPAAAVAFADFFASAEGQKLVAESGLLSVLKVD